MQNELWKPIPNYVGYYEVSSYGNIRRIRPSKGTRVGKIVKPYIAKGPNAATAYARIVLYVDTKYKTELVHRLVAHAFIGDIAGLEVNHLNGDGTDNRVSNLEIVTSRDNKLHRHRVLRRASGESHWAAKLTTADIVSIRKQLTSYCRGDYSRLAKQYGVSASHIRNINLGTRWATL